MVVYSFLGLCLYSCARAFGRVFACSVFCVRVLLYVLVALCLCLVALLVWLCVCFFACGLVRLCVAFVRVLVLLLVCVFFCSLDRLFDCSFLR